VRAAACAGRVPGRRVSGCRPMAPERAAQRATTPRPHGWGLRRRSRNRRPPAARSGVACRRSGCRGPRCRLPSGSSGARRRRLCARRLVARGAGCRRGAIVAAPCRGRGPGRCSTRATHGRVGVSFSSRDQRGGVRAGKSPFSGSTARKPLSPRSARRTSPLAPPASLGPISLSGSEGNPSVGRRPRPNVVSAALREPPFTRGPKGGAAPGPGSAGPAASLNAPPAPARRPRARRYTRPTRARTRGSPGARASRADGTPDGSRAGTDAPCA